MKATNHQYFMQSAIEIAHQNRHAPFGSVLVDVRGGAVVAQGVNASKQNPVLHGEIAAIIHYAEQGFSDWSDLAIYTTAEPCCMCQAALLWAGVSRLYFGVSIDDLKLLGWRQIDISSHEVASKSWNPEMIIQGGILHEQCLELFRTAIA